MTYSEKLRDPRWQRRRLEIFQREDFRCVICRRADKNIQAHHLIYLKRDPWDYPLDMFQTLCDDCHEERQELTDKASNSLRIALAKIPTQRLEVVAQRLIAEAFAEMNT